MTILVVFAWSALDVPLRGSLAAFSFVVLLGALAFVGIGLLIAAAGVAVPLADERLHAWSTSIIAYGMSIAFAGLFALQFIKEMPLDYFILLAILALALVLGDGDGRRSRLVLTLQLDALIEEDTG